MLKQALAGSPDAFWTIIQPHERMIYAVALGILRDHDAAQDTVHDVYLRAFSTLGNLRAPSKLQSWLYTMTRNLSYEHLRKRQREDRAVQHPQPVAVIPVTDMMIREEELVQLEQALDQLPEPHRIVLGLKYMSGMSCRQIADTLGIGLEAAKSRLFEARKALRRRMQAAAEESATPHTHGRQNSTKREDSPKEEES